MRHVPLSRDEAIPIHSPRWTKPAVLGAGESLDVIAASALVGVSEARLAAKDAVRSLGAPASVRPLGSEQCVGLSFRLPPDVPAGLYDLHLLNGARTLAVEPCCVWVPAAGGSEFTFVHMSDFHMVRMNTLKREVRADSRKLVIRGERLKRLMRHLVEEIRPDFILNTGDLITRYYKPGKRLFPLEHMRRQLRAAHRALSGIRIPQFITPGNHDVSFPALKAMWRRLMGGRWDGGTDDYTFEYRGVRFIALERAVEYNAAHEGVSFEMRPQQKAWLTAELDRPTRARTSVIFLHCDYRNELAPLIEGKNVSKVFYGHWNKRCLPEDRRAVDGLLHSSLAYQKVVVSGSGLSCVPGLPVSEF